MSDGTSSDFFAMTLTLTPAVDVSISVPTLTPGTLHRLPNLRQDPGGKGINVSKALNAFGVPTLATGLLGGERGYWIESKLSVLGIPHQFVHTADETRMNVKISEDNGRLTELNSVNTSGHPRDWTELGARLKMAKSGQWIALCGRLPQGIRPTWYQDAIYLAKEQGVRTLLDSSGEGLRHGIEAGPDIVKPNRAELSQWAGRDLSRIEDVVEAAQCLVDKGVKTVVVSLGQEGLLAITSESGYRVEVPNVEAVSSVGAGDTLVAGLLYGIYHKYSFLDTIQFGAAAGTAAVSTPGSQQPRLHDVEHLFAQIKVSPLAMENHFSTNK